MKIWRKRIAESLNQLINHEAVYRTAPATPGLLKTHNFPVKLNNCKETPSAGDFGGKT